MENKIITIKYLKIVRKKCRKIGFCSGCFDLFHAGHAVFLNKAKSFCDTLVVGVGRDEIIKKIKKRKAANPESNRIYTVASMKSVDYAILNENVALRGNIDFYNIVKELKPDFFILNSDSGGIKEKKELCRILNIKFKILKRNLPKRLKPTSTTEIIKKIRSA